MDACYAFLLFITSFSFFTRFQYFAVSVNFSLDFSVYMHYTSYHCLDRFTAGNWSFRPVFWVHSFLPSPLFYEVLLQYVEIVACYIE